MTRIATLAVVLCCPTTLAAQYGSVQLLATYAGHGLPGLVACDFDGDGDVDFASNGQWCENLGGAVFGPLQPTTSSCANAPVGIAVGPYNSVWADIDGDGDEDLVDGNNPSAGALYWSENTGAGNLGPRRLIVQAYCQSVHPFDPTLCLDGDDTSVIFAADLNRDGTVDLLSGHWDYFSRFYLHRNLGGGVFQSQLLGSGDDPVQIGRADLDGDGDLDIFFTGKHHLSWMENSSPPVVASATVYGAGCGTPPLTLSPLARPVLGSTASAQIDHAPTQLAGATIGWSDTSSGFPVTLPYELSGIGMPNCWLLHSRDVFGLPTTPMPNGALQLTVAVPHQPILVGSHVFVQAYAYSPGANALQFVASNGIDWRIGNQ